MAEFNNNIEQMYVFIVRAMKSSGCDDISDNSEWLRQVDEKYGNGDGNLVKSEFSYFVKKELTASDFEKFSNKTGNYEADKNDIINKFWAKIDTNRALKHIEGTRLYDQNALNDDEIEKANFNIKRHEILQEYMKDLPEPNCPPFDDSSIVAQYRSKINQSLMRSMVEDDVHPDVLVEYFDSKLTDLIRTTCADIIAQFYLNTCETELENMGYSKNELNPLLFGSNSQTQKLINEYISDFKLPKDDKNYNEDGLDKLNSDVRVYEQQAHVSEMVEVIGNKIQDLLQQYLGMAFPDKAGNSEDPFENPKAQETRTKDINGIQTRMYLNGNSMLVRCGYDPETNDIINELQQFAVRRKVEEDLADEMSRATEEQAPYYESCQSLYQPIMENYIKSLISKMTVGEYNSYYDKSAVLTTELFERADYKQLVKTITDISERVKEEVNNIFNQSSTGNSNTIKSQIEKILTYGGTVNDITIPNFGDEVTNYIMNAAKYDSNEAVENIKRELIGKFTVEILKNMSNTGIETQVSSNNTQTQANNTTDIQASAQNQENVILSDDTVSSIRTGTKEGFVVLVKRDLVDIFKNGLPSGMSLDEINTAYNSMVETAREKGDLQEIKQAAILYLDYVSTANSAETSDIKDKIKLLIKNKFGNNYNAKINEETYKPETVNGDMQALITQIQDIEYLAHKAVATFSISNCNPTLGTSQSTSSNISSCTIVDRNGKTITGGITYVLGDENGNIGTVSNNAGSISLVGNKISMNSLNIPGTVTAYVYVMVDGVLLRNPNARRAVTLTSKFDLNTLSSSVKYSTDNSSTTQDSKLNGQSIVNLLNSNEWVNIGEGCSTDDLNVARTTAKSGIAALLNGLKDKFISAGLDKTQVTNAIVTTINYYQSALDATSDIQYKTGDSDGYIDVWYQKGLYGDYECARNQFFHQTTRYHDQDGRDDLANYMNNNKMRYTSGLGIWEGWNNTDSYGYYVSISAVLQKFQNFYNYQY